MITQEVKAQMVNEAILHREQDLFIKGSFWDGRKGSSVGCFVKTQDNPNRELSKITGMPEWTHHLQDSIFQGLPNSTRPYWSERFFKAAPVRLSHEDYILKIRNPFFVFILKDLLDTFDHVKYPDVKKAINRVIKLYKKGGDYKAAYDAAHDACDAAHAAFYDNAHRATRATRATARDAAYAAYDAAYAHAEYSRTTTYAAHATYPCFLCSP